VGVVMRAVLRVVRRLYVALHPSPKYPEVLSEWVPLSYGPSWMEIVLKDGSRAGVMAHEWRVEEVQVSRPRGRGWSRIIPTRKRTHVMTQVVFSLLLDREATPKVDMVRLPLALLKEGEMIVKSPVLYREDSEDRTRLHFSWIEPTWWSSGLEFGHPTWEFDTTVGPAAVVEASVGWEKPEIVFDLLAEGRPRRLVPLLRLPASVLSDDFLAIFPDRWEGAENE